MADLLGETIAGIPGLDAAARDKARARLADLTAPAGSLGKLLEIAERVAAITGNPAPPTDRKVVVVMAADHGVAAEGVSAYPAEVTAQMARNFAGGGAAINVIARAVGARVVVVDMGIDADLSDLAAAGRIRDLKIGRGTRNFAREPAMTRAEASRGIEAGIGLARELHREGLDLLVPGEMGIGNTTAASAVAAVLIGVDPAEVTGRGTGIDDTARARKIEIIRGAIKRLRPTPRDPLDLLSKVGGFEIAGLCGLMLGAAERRVPLILDGVISTSAALLAAAFDSRVENFLFAGHFSADAGHHVMLRMLGIEPILNLSLRLGEGTGGALALPIVDAAARLLREMATFSSVSVARSTRGG